MINAQLIAMEFNALLPEAEKPQYTEGYEGFFLLVKMEGTVENASLTYIIRDHDKEKFEYKRKQSVRLPLLNSKYGENRVTYTVKDQYYNMREKIEPLCTLFR